MTAAVTIVWQEGERRVIRHENGKHYPQRQYIGVNGLDWYYEPEYRGYKTATGAKKSLPQF